MRAVCLLRSRQEDFLVSNYNQIEYDTMLVSILVLIICIIIVSGFQRVTLLL